MRSLRSSSGNFRKKEYLRMHGSRRRCVRWDPRDSAGSPIVKRAQNAQVIPRVGLLTVLLRN